MYFLHNFVEKGHVKNVQNDDKICLSQKGGAKMKRVRAACLLRTICFQPKDGDFSDFAKEQAAPKRSR